MEFISVKIRDDKLQINATSSLIKFKQEVSAITKTEDFTINYCGDELLENLDYTQIRTQDEFEHALSVIKKLNRFLRIDLNFFETIIDSISSPLNSEFSDKSSIEMLCFNKLDSYISPSMIDSPQTNSVLDSKGSKSEQNSSSSKLSSNNFQPRFVYNNQTIYIEKVIKREKKIKQKASRFEIKSQSPIRIEPVPKLKKINSSALITCSKCKKIIKSVLNYCEDSKSYLLCSKCKSDSIYVMKSVELPEKAQCKAIINYFLKMGFSDPQKIEETLMKTNWCYSRTLSSLLGY